jgi:hypothetical protein
VAGGWAMGLVAVSKEGLLFEKRSKNFCLFGARVGAKRALNFKSFLVLFCKKELLS